MGFSFKSSDSKQKLIDKVTHARSSLNITRPIDGTTDSTSELVHAQDNSLEISQARDINSASIDFKNHGSGSRTAFSSETQVNFSCKFFAYYDDFDLTKKIVLLVHLLFLSSLLIVSTSSDVIVVMLEIALLLSTSLLAALEGLDRLMAAAFWLLIMILHILNTTACVAVNEMVQLLFECNGDTQGRNHILPSSIEM